MDPITAPFLTYEDVSSVATEFLKRYDPSRQMPVDIEAIIEFGLGLDIVPRRGLMQADEVDGYLSLDLTAINVDEGILERQPTRYRFTLAHELGHHVLHGDLLRTLGIKSPAEWLTFYRTLDEADHGWFERQAYWFAGVVLVPEEHLLTEFESAAEKMAAEGMDGDGLTEQSRLTVAGHIAKKFWVSTVVVRKRLREVGIW
ncbi:MAG: ImmA/IrrE family metallo-endopeptidase [Armatimonadetes bacterium]|nr:ImmA/IrrE family metallo-endopeptidase [Armatimonadota bacterium]